MGHMIICTSNTNPRKQRVVLQLHGYTWIALWLTVSAGVSFVFSELGFHTSNFIRMAAKPLEENKIEKQLVWHTDSDYLTEDEDCAPTAARKVKRPLSSSNHHHSRRHRGTTTA
jgi:hypothetical protein